MNKVLVTGASGFVGKALVSRLRDQKYEAIGIGSADGDISIPATLGKLAGARFSRVFHLAARTFVPDSWGDSDAFYRTNVLGTANILEFCKKGGFPLTYVSAYLYGEPESLPIAEDAPVRPNNPYALSKHLAEQLCSFYSGDIPGGVTVFRPFNVFGEGQDSKFLIPTIIRQVAEQPVIRVKDLEPRRDYIYLRDMVDCLTRVPSGQGGYGVYNVGSGVSHSVREIIEIVQGLMGTQKEVQDDKVTRKNEIANVVADISSIRRHFAWQPRYSLREGIREMLVEKTRSGS